MNLGISGRKAIVAGGSAGLGYATARALAGEGAELLLSARGEARLTDAAHRLAKETGATIHTVVADYSTPTGRAAILDRFPTPDILVTASSPPAIVDDYFEIGPAEWQKAFAIGFLAPVELMRLTTPSMAKRGWGRIVNISTVAAVQPTLSRLLSGAPRSALSNYTSAVSNELADRNVVINNLLPGLFTTEGASTHLDTSAGGASTNGRSRLISPVGGWELPADRWGNPDEFGPLAAVFCSDLVSYVTGRNLDVDGGLTSAIF